MVTPNAAIIINTNGPDHFYVGSTVLRNIHRRNSKLPPEFTNHFSNHVMWRRMLAARYGRSVFHYFYPRFGLSYWRKVEAIPSCDARRYGGHELSCNNLLLDVY
ncbi:hypothetical protein GWI33_005007 [Rhynchophorus ferrugineus]|uniref:Uncharacterized protein n=1 Tax=Rhynchophorus ferrugineus TaxID=354439 RepID=A0A834IWK7_RHYFE|nr:hypothetical protein GWI33_005007 [Rhynchophorus ferrugineus]